MPRGVQLIFGLLNRRTFASCSTRRNYSLPRTLRQVIETASENGSSTSNIEVNGWIKSVRRQKNVAFAQLSDGTTVDGRGLQIVFEDPTLADGLTMGSSVKILGNMVKSQGKGQAVELAAQSIKVLGECDAETYPIQKKTHTTEFLREHAHFRPRTDEIARMLRLRHAVKKGFEEYYDMHGFLNVHAPIVTLNDCEGGGEVFKVLPDANAEPSTRPESQEFFGSPAFLTVSSQLHLEVFSSAFPRVYTLQPAFRAERSHTSRHLSEFWMLEAEIAFVEDLEGIMSTLESSIKHIFSSEELRRCLLPDRLSYCDKVSSSPWKRIAYGEAVKSLQASMGQEAITWGDSISTEQERWLADHVGDGLPLFVTDYPASIKPFYMRANAGDGDRQTVACFDLLVPRIGELAGGSMREERFQNMEESLKKFGMDPAQYSWYTELRKFGTTPHGGYGLGFERLISWIGGWENVRECIPAPRWKDRCIL
ncbi:hypothetical protein M408DRAFT_333518 [Serendipita vermifera MAFF 305830]|uniref:asparagine--tRNA ligase n=1 Tax=Serendipita vermifera MAFF 305830 TaxID=933852 RepID=A0A0C2W4C0_SERVB|nr:hypothetical protein M408DRAFT_333518 [Serendipita vermifera MAFF 305830]